MNQKDDTIFELVSIRIDGNHYPIRRVNYNRIGFFTTVFKAKNAIRKYVDILDGMKIEYGEEYLGFILKEYLVDSIPNEDNCISVCTFLSNGELNDKNMMDKNKKFHGRPNENIRFNVGDVVEILDYNTLELCIVSATPPNVREFERIKKKAEASMQERGNNDYIFEMDDSDDQYKVFQVKGEYHLHIRSELVFKPTKKVSKRLRQKLLRQLNNSKIS